MTGASSKLETDVLIVGTGPAGASSALMLATYGVRNIVINKYGWTARTPRSHITNQRTMEIIRDLGLEPEAKQLAVPNDLMGENPLVTSLAGEELGRIRTWGTHPRHRLEQELASPAHMCDLPQDLLEPMLLNAATRRGTTVRFGTEYIGLNQDADGVTATVLDRMTGQEYQIRAKYLIAADGANSKVVDDLRLPVEGRMGVSGSMNIVFEADLSQYVAHRPSVLYWVIQPGANTGGLGIGVVRMVRPWYRWLAIWGFDLADGPPELTDSIATEIVHGLIGNRDIPIKVESTSTWTVNDAYVPQISSDRVFCMGDAIHRHPPTNGLGSNTSIQDAYNLAWKVAHVLQGHADPSLLDTYNTERAPIAAQIVRRANASLELFPPVFKALGLLDSRDPEEMKRNMAARKLNTPAAARQRAELRQAIDATNPVYNCHGVEMNQRYESAAIIPDGTPDPGFERDPELYHEASSRPGSHLPHVWLERKGHLVSTLDVCGQGRFTLLTGIDGEAWTAAAQKAGVALGVDIRVHVIGPGREFDDPYGDFARMRGTTEAGALLVRPDVFIAWRSQDFPKRAKDDLVRAMVSILGRSGATPGRK